jgi:intracellular multiplication protein IcmL
MADSALEMVQLRNRFYRDNYRRIMAILLVAGLAILILVGALAYVVTHPPAPRYFATDSTGRIVPLVPLDQPNLSTPSILQWANSAAVAAFSYNFVNYRQQLQAASEFFTPEGWQAFLNSLTASNNLQAVTSKKLVVSAVATGAPVVLQQGVLNGQYSWRVQMPLLVTYQSVEQVSQQSLIVNMLITRVSTLTSVRGIGIAQFVATSSGTTNQIGA